MIVSTTKISLSLSNFYLFRIIFPIYLFQFKFEQCGNTIFYNKTTNSQADSIKMVLSYLQHFHVAYAGPHSRWICFYTLKQSYSSILVLNITNFIDLIFTDYKIF